MSGIIYTPPAGGGSVGDLDAVMMIGNTTTVNYIGTGIALSVRGVIGPTTYRPDKNDYCLLCDVSAGNVNIELNAALGNVYAIKLVNFSAGKVVRITVFGGGTLDGFTTYELTRKHACVIVSSKQNNADYTIIGSYEALSSTASGLYSILGFAGTSITIPHTLNAVPTGVTITSASIGASLLLANAYYVTADATNITVDFGTPLATPSLVEIYWTVTRN